MSKKSEVKKSVRYKAMQILVAIEQEDAYLNLKLSDELEKSQLSQSDKNLLTEIVYGVTQHRLTLDYLLTLYVKTKMPLWLRTILRLSFFQLIYLSKVPNYAVVNEANELTYVKANKKVAHFVNAVLRNFLREKEDVLNTLENLPLTKENIAIQVSMPLWLVNYFSTQMSLEEVKQLGKSLLDKPSLSVRVEKNVNITQLLSQFEYERSVLSSQGVRMKNAMILHSDLFDKGLVTIQDETSMLVAQVANLKGNEVVLDACAAPGGKTTHIAQFLTEKGIIYALDKYDHKINLIKENASRLNVSHKINAKKGDAREVSKLFNEDTFDVAFVDAPCSGLGLMRRKPDIKYKKFNTDFSELSKIQLDILNEVDKVVKVGGKIVYSTCTMSTIENEDVIEDFLKAHMNYTRQDLSFMNLPKNCYNKNNSIEIYPHYYNTDGFYISVLEKLA